MAEAGSSKSATATRRSFEELNVEIQGAALSATKLAAALPSDVSFHRSVDNEYAAALDACSDKALGLANRLLSLLSSADSSKTSRSKGKYKFEDEDDVTDNFRTVAIDALDLSLERADTFLDKHLGRSKPAAVAINPKPIAKKAVAGRLDHSLTHAVNLVKPQLRFKRKVDNLSTNRWIPSLRHKYNAKVPLGLNLRDPSDIEDLGSETSITHPYEHEIRNLSYPRRMFERSDATPPRSFEETPFTWVDSRTSFNNMLEKLRAATELAIDLEHHSFRTFSGFLCLMQISTREEDFVVDTLVLREELEELNEVFTNPEIVKVFHGAESDIVWLQQDFNLYIVNLFDTFHASKVLNFPKHGLASLLEMYCDFIPDKRYQLADWRIRPLPDEMLQYARSDTHFLLYIYDSLRNALLDRDLNSIDSAEPQNSLRTVLDRSQETALRTYRRESYDFETGHGPGGWDTLAQKWNKALSGVNLEVYRCVHHWRDKIAREEDESTGYVLPNHYLFRLADHPPADMAALLSVFRPVPPLVKTKAASLLDCIRAAIKRASTANGLVTSVSTPAVKEVVKEPQQGGLEAMETEVESKPSLSTSSQMPSRMWDSQRSDTMIASSSSLLASLASHSSSISSLQSSSSPDSSVPSLFPILKSIGSTILRPSSRYLEVMHKIHGSLMVVPSAPTVLPDITAKSEASLADEKSVAVPESVEEIPFIPASQRQSASISTNHEVDGIVVVGQRQKKRKRTKTAATDESASSTKKAKSSEPSPEVEDNSQKDGESFDFASEPNFLDNVPVPANSAKSNKAKGKAKKVRAVEFGDFPAPPRAVSEVKSGNKSHTFRK